MDLGEGLTLFDQWLDDATSSEPNDPNAMALATVDASGMPNIRTVLLKARGEHGFTFYTNLNSAKGIELATNPNASLCFDWKSIGRSVVVRGSVVAVPDRTADLYFRSRSRGSRIGAWASQQSRPLKSRRALLIEAAKYAAKFGIGDVPRPPCWTGLTLRPSIMEFHHAERATLTARLA